MAQEVAYRFTAQDRFTRIGRNIKASVKGLTTAVEDMGDEAQATRKKFDRMGNGIKSAGRKIAVVGAVIVAVGLASVVQAGKFEALAVSFEVLAGSAEKGLQVFKDIKRFSAATPFQLEEVANSGKILLAFGISTETVVDRLRMLGDMAAGSGKPLAEFALIFGKIKAKGKLTGEELQQLAEKTVNLREALGEKFGLTPEQVEKAVSAGAVKFEHVVAVMEDMTSEGGRFFRLTQKMSKTLPGLWSTFKDNVVQAADALGTVLVEKLKIKRILDSLIEKFSTFIEKFPAFAKAHPILINIGLALAAFVVVLGPLLILAGSLVVTFGFLSAAAATAGITITALVVPMLALVAPLLLIPLAIAGIAATSTFLALNWDKLGDKVIKLAKGIMFLISPLQMMPFLFDLLVEKAKSLKAVFTDVLGSVGNLFSGFADKLSGLGSNKLSALLNLTGLLDISSTSSATVDINLSAPKDVVKSIQSSSRGTGLNLNTGVALAGAS